MVVVEEAQLKWTERPTLHDARHLLAFVAEHVHRAPQGYIVCRCPYALRLHDKITAIPWFQV